MSETCKWLHEQLEQLPLISYPFDLNDLPRSGTCFFYEEGERWGHGGKRPRIVRVGTHRDGTFRGRISEHFLLNDSQMNFDSPSEQRNCHVTDVTYRRMSPLGYTKLNPGRNA